MSTQARNTVRAAQLLKSMSGSTGDPLQALLCFFEPILLELTGREFDCRTFAEHVRRAYGWDFNEEVADGFRRAFLSRGWLKPRIGKDGFQVRVEGHGVETITYQPSEAVAAAADVETIDENIERLTAAFRKFLTGFRTGADNLHLSDEDILDKLVVWLLDNGNGKFTDDDSVADTSEPSADDQTDYLIARFVREVDRTDLILSADLQRVATVGLLSELAQDFHKPTTRVKKCRLTVYIDSPVALDLLGTSGKEAAELTRTIISKLQQIGATITIFDTSVRELTRTLTAVLMADPNQRWGPSHEAILRGEIDEAFLATIRADPANAFRRFNISVKSPGFERALSADQYFTEAQYGRFYGKIFGVNANSQDREQRCRHDAKCVAMITRLRKGYEHPDVFESTHIFLTRNRTFSRLARQFCINENIIDEGSVGPFINMHDFAASLWLRTGLHSDVEVPRRQLLVGCERVLALKRPVVVQAQRAILSLKKSGSLSEEQMRQIEAVMAQDRSMALISDHIRGSNRKLTDDDYLKIYERVLQDEREYGYQKGVADIVEDRNQILLELADTKAKTLEQITSLKEQLSRVDDILMEEQGRNNRRASKLISDFNSWLGRFRKRCRYALIFSTVLLLAISVYKEIGTIEAIASGEPFDLYGHIPLILAAILPLVVLLADQSMKVFAIDRPVDRYIVDPMARRKLRRMMEERDLTPSDLTASSIPLLLPNAIGRSVIEGDALDEGTLGSEFLRRG